MPVLQNTKHELFAQSIFSGKPIGESAIIAGYSPKCPSIATKLAKRSEINARIEELKKRSADTAVMSVRERQVKLTDIAKQEWTTKDGVTPVPNIMAIDKLNKMDGVYTTTPNTYTDARHYTFILPDKATEKELAQIIEGECKQLDVVSQATQS